MGIKMIYHPWSLNTTNLWTSRVSNKLDACH
jgi:hypothetical protein